MRVRPRACSLFLGLLATVIILIRLCGVTHAGEYVFRSELTTIYYDHPEQLGSYAEKLLSHRVPPILANRCSEKNAPSICTAIGEFTDQLMRQVQLALDMNLPGLRVNIRLYSSNEKLAAVYARILEESSPETYVEWTLKSGPTPVAFYWKSTDTIYLQTEKLSAGIVAHELAHAVIDHYFVIRPPVKISEILCQYVQKRVVGGKF